MSVTFPIESFAPDLGARMVSAQNEIEWLRQASGEDLLLKATDALGLKALPGLVGELTAVDLGNQSHSELVSLFSPHFPAGTSTAEDLADQVQLCRAFEDPGRVVEEIGAKVLAKVLGFPRSASDLKVGSNPGDVLDPYILAANFELLSERSLTRTIEYTASHKILMKIEDMVGHLHELVLGSMRGNFRVPEPSGKRGEGKERMDPLLNPFPGADVGQVPVPERPGRWRLFQVKSKTGSAKGGDAKRLGDQLAALEAQYGADTFYAAIVGNTLRGHRSRAGVTTASPNTAIMVGAAALNELTQSAVGPELLLRTYQRAFRKVAAETAYKFSDIAAAVSQDFEHLAEEQGTDFLTAWLHDAVDGPHEDQDSRLT